ncbi:hypothetical protein BBBOND_0102740 [Babesia bigemina]|uniref:Uncharacterized protein n=1 Tax=Babesia bigemina TaxID=5866 RepID=A0A061D1F4_BABBI|nr:hypothetical protein BBBOND_0102740 [Babesia bigemina]CDR93947.1 hypothetical protein BBBOND_0102740 [Babesia bigemina]|eukprot:XP_012766133.1 hypothetical protein BBBOND_0102740 [Babesia bigemina]
MVYYSLTDAPQNLKEGIDWLVALKGDDAEKNLKAMGEAVHKFLINKPVGKVELPGLEEVKRITKEFLEKPELKDLPYVNDILGKFEGHINKEPSLFAKIFYVDECDYRNILRARRIKPEDIAQDVTEVVESCEQLMEGMKVPDEYESAYNYRATWDSSCSYNPEACAKVFVGIAPMLFVGIGAMLDARYADLPNEAEGAAKVLQAMGFVEPQCRAGIDASKALNELRGVELNVLDTLYDLSGFWAFY